MCLTTLWASRACYSDNFIFAITTTTTTTTTAAATTTTTIIIMLNNLTLFQLPLHSYIQ
jgi:hypothetical protein